MRDYEDYKDWCKSSLIEEIKTWRYTAEQSMVEC